MVWFNKRKKDVKAVKAIDMKLDEFISESIYGIFTGITIAAKKCTKNQGGTYEGTVNPIQYTSPEFPKNKDNPLSYNHGIQNIEFEINVNITKDSNNEASIGIVGGAVGVGGSTQLKSGTSSENKIKFSIPVLFPAQNPVD